MALVSPGVSISINDQSQYVNSNVGSVPLVVLATEQDKTNPSGTIAAGTTKANAGKLLAFTSQRDLITQMGTPKFALSATGTPLNGSAINEYGLLAAYSALGISNRLFAIRADIDLNALVGTSVRPSGTPADGTYWLDIANTNWGIYVWNQTTVSYGLVSPLTITDPSQVDDQTVDNPAIVGDSTTAPTPISSVGQIGQYALVLVNPDGTTPTNIRLFYKKGGPTAYTGSGFASSNTWIEVGSPDWQVSFPTITGTVSNNSLSIPSGSTFTINGVTPTATSTNLSVSGFATYINNASIPGVHAAAHPTTNQLMLFGTSTAGGNGSITITDGTHNPFQLTGLLKSPATTALQFTPTLAYSTYVNDPTYTNTHPTGSIWWKQGSIGNGFTPNLYKFNASTGQYDLLSVPSYQSFATAIYGLDPVGGGINITHEQVISTYGIVDTSWNNLHFSVQLPNTTTIATSGTPNPDGTTAGDQFTLRATRPGDSTFNSTTITLSGETAQSFVSDVLAANIPYVSATLNSNGTVSLIHTTGGQLGLNNVDSGTALSDIGFVSGEGSGFYINTATGSVVISNWSNITQLINYTTSAPTSNPVDGELWYYSNPADVDIMINNNGWKGYRNVTFDARGYNLHNTDPNGVIVSYKPVSQSDGMTTVKAGDLWLDTSDLEHYPALHRFNGTDWIAIDNTNHIASDGIIFADARWSTNGTTNPIFDALPAISDLVTSNYLDLDAPDHRLYPQGTLLFNTRRSGYNVKKFVQNYFNANSFPPPSSGNNPNYLPTSTPTETNAWVSASGQNSLGVPYFHDHAQRNIIVSAMQSALDSSLDAMSLNYDFNLICAPGYPELIPNMLTLNDNRGDTAFVIGDTPLDLIPNITDITNWVNNTDGLGLPSDASGSPYLGLYYPAGRTNDLSGNTVVVPASHAVLRTFLYSDQVSYPWFPPAGVNRGLVTNLSDIGYVDFSTGSFVHNGVSQGLRDALFTVGINPITQLPNSGLVVFGQLTRSASTSAQNRVNVVRLENYLRKIFSSISNGYLFEPNDAVTRKSISTQIEGALNNVLAHRGLYDYLVICDTSNNTPATIANNQLYVDVAIEPMKDVEYIYIPIAIYNPGAIAALNTTST
jgi:Phage tail sheath C-terminal domain